jgi:hypothetical protein
VELGRLAAPTVAALAGLWTGIDATPLDAVQAPDGVRAARAFYRRVEAGQVEAELRTRVLSVQPPLPEPGDHTEQAVYLPDPAAACRNMAEVWWARHEHELVGRRVPPQPVARVDVGAWALIKMFFAFVWSGLRGVPHDLLRGVVVVSAAAFARQVHKLVLGAGDSAYTVVANGVDRDGRPAGWRSLGAAAGELDRKLAEARLTAPQPARPDLRVMWDEFADGAMTLIDGGRRTLDRPKVGPNPGVVRAPAEVAPPPGAGFPISGQLTADIGRGVAVGDVLGTETLRRRLEVFTTDPVRAVDATRTLNDLAAWENIHSRSYTVQAGHRLVTKLHEVVRELRFYLEWLQRAGAALGNEEEVSRSRKWVTRLLVLLALIGLAAGPILYLRETVRPWIAGAITLVPLFVLLLYLLIGFVKTRREIFRDLARRQQLISEKQAVEANLRQTVIDVRQLADAYEQYLVWSRVVGAVLNAPFGSPVPPTASGADITSGLPRTTRLARAQVDEHATGTAAAVLRRDVFSIGWLGRLWDVHVDGAGAQMGSYELVGRPEALRDLRGGVAESHLQAWAELLTTSGTSSAAGDRQWEQVRRSLGTGHGQLGTDLLRSVQPIGPPPQRTVALHDFLNGVDEQAAGPGEELAAEHFTADGRAERRNAIDVHWTAEERIGLSRVAVLVQLTEACDPWNFAVAARRAEPDEHRYQAPPGWAHTPAPVGNGHGRPTRPTDPGTAANGPGTVPEAPPGFH